ncbi:hypothetical protein N431DRAFT_534360 [Stipitochalara longipes BDJ]|nr:hypothetical protein N431DRAFT_534360 [Stipitochalara longipes BDJ]
MLALYKPPRRRSQDSESTIELERVVPAGTPYLTKVNGKLVMAREKRENKAKNVAADLLGEAFGVKTRVIRKRAQSLDKPTGPLIIGGVPYVPQQQVHYPAPYTMPLPQQAFSSPNLIPYTPQPTFMLPNPSQQNLHQLQQMQAHFGNMYPSTVSNHPQNGKVEVTTTTITITKHICAGCGRIRSKKYHHDHPLKEGEKPEPDFCRKCQKDSSSTDSGGSSRENKKKKAKKTKHKKHHRKHSKHSSDDEDSDSPAPKALTKPKHQEKKEPKRVPSEEYIIVEEEISEEETPRPRGRVRERVVEKIEVDRYPSRPRQSSQRSKSRQPSHKIPRKPVRSAKIRETVVRENIRRRSPSIEYDYVETERKAPVEERVEAYPRKVPIHFYDDNVHEQRAPSNVEYRENGTRERGSSGKEYSVEEVETVSHVPSSRAHYREQSNHERGQPQQGYIIEEVEVADQPGPRKEYYVERKVVTEPPQRNCREEREIPLFIRAEEARRRRRRERNAPSTAPWEAPHVIHPTENEDVIVVTERYEYRPKKQGSSEESRRRQEYVDRATMDRHQANQFEIDEAARYYHDDWSRAEPNYGREPLRRMEQHERSYRRDRPRDVELSDSEASYEYRIGQGSIPRAPTPPSAIYHTNNVENWQDQPQTPYPLSSDSEVPQRLNNLSRGNGYQQQPPKSAPRSRSTSRARPAYVREEIDGGTERVSPSKALIPSPRRSRERERAAERYVEATTSELARRERAAESEVKHVSFRETPTMLSMQNSWTETSELGPVHPETTGSGWGHASEIEGRGWDR